VKKKENESIRHCCHRHSNMKKIESRNLIEAIEVKDNGIVEVA